MLTPLLIIKNTFDKLNILFYKWKNDYELFSYSLSLLGSSLSTIGASLYIFNNNYKYLYVLKYISYTYLITDSIQLCIYDFFQI